MSDNIKNFDEAAIALAALRYDLNETANVTPATVTYLPANLDKILDGILDLTVFLSRLLLTSRSKEMSIHAYNALMDRLDIQEAGAIVARINRFSRGPDARKGGLLHLPKPAIIELRQWVQTAISVVCELFPVAAVRMQLRELELSVAKLETHVRRTVEAGFTADLTEFSLFYHVFYDDEEPPRVVSAEVTASGVKVHLDNDETVDASNLIDSTAAEVLFHTLDRWNEKQNPQ